MPHDPHYPWAADREALVVGVMSGTSCDGLDVAFCRVSGSGREAGVELLEFATTSYSEELAAALRRASDPTRASCALVAELDFHLGRRIGGAVAEVAEGRPVDLVASHGHTVCHLLQGGGGLGEACTVQIGQPAVIAETTGLPVVSGFRARDVAAGGQGAPLLPYLDWVLLSAPDGAPRSIVNVGGIANVTHLAGHRLPVGFDTGPGNLVINEAARRAQPGLPYDVDGRLAAQGVTDEAWVRRLMGHPHFSRRPPKSTGREEFGEALVEQVTREASAPRGEDLVATMTRWVARSIAVALREDGLQSADTYLCGGGCHNPTLVAWLAEELNGPVGTTDELGVPPDAKEAMGFALMGSETMRGRPANLPSVTGAAGPRLLGSITWP